MALSCAELRLRLDADERLDALEVREHAAGCVDCHRALERWRSVMGAMRSWSEEPPPPFLHTRIMSELRAAAKGERHGWRAWFAQRPVWASSALAAAFVLVVASVVMLRAPQETHAPESPSVERGPMPVAPPAAVEHRLAPGESEHGRDLGQPQALENGPAQKREAPRLRKQALPAEPQPEKEVFRDAELRAEPRSRQSEALRDVERAVSGGSARAPAPLAESGPAVDEVRAAGTKVAPDEQATTRPSARAFEVARAKTALVRLRARIVPLAGGPSRSVEVSPALLAAGPCLIDVDERGRPQVATAPAKPGAGRGVSANGRSDAAQLSGELSDERTLAQDDRRAIESLKLSPGRYRLERIDE